MILRFMGISIVKWLSSFIVVYLMMNYVIPASIIGFWRIVLIWCATVLSAFVFAEWAFNTKSPDRKDILQLMIVGLCMNVLLSVTMDILMQGRPVYIFESFDIQVQYILEVLIVPVAAYVAQKRRQKSTIAEGLIG